MSRTVGECFAQHIEQWGLKPVFGYPGDGINHVLRGLEKAGDKIECVVATGGPPTPSPARRRDRCARASPADQAPASVLPHRQDS